MADRSGKPAPDREFIPTGAQARLRDLASRIWRLWLATVFAAVTGTPSALFMLFLSNSIFQLAAIVGHNNNVLAYTFAIGFRVGLGMLIAFGTTVGTPWLWRHTESPALLRAIASTSIQAYGLAVGLIIPPPLPGYLITGIISGVGIVTLWLWQRRWRGVGIAPAPLAGILRPAIHPGQIWYATIAGNKETKIRPIIVLGESPDNESRWNIAYCTTQPPRSDWMNAQYVHIPYGVVRGLPKETWVSARDLRDIPRSRFRTYLGLVPDAVYRELCEAANLEPAPDARVISEDRAGRQPGPMEAALRNALGLDHSGTPQVVDTANWETIKTLLFMPIDPPKKQPRNAFHPHPEKRNNAKPETHEDE